MNVIYEPLPRSQTELETEWLRERIVPLSLGPLFTRLRTLVAPARQAPAPGTPKRRAGIVTRAG